MDKKEYIVNQLRKTVHKKYENYCITRIINKLDNLEIQFITQQLFKRNNKKIALADLYFPQINTYVEIDESYHLKNKDNDMRRTIEIKNNDEIIKRKIQNLEEIITQPITELRIKADDSVTIDELNTNIDNVVEEINRRIKSLGNNFIAWNLVNNDYNYYINKKNIKLSDKAKFSTIQEVSELFNKGYNGMQKCYFCVDKKHNVYVWCPKLKLSADDYINLPYENEITDDGKYILESAKESNEEFLNKLINSNINEIRYVFAKYRDETGENSYKFCGIYELDKNKSIEVNKRAWKKTIENEIDLSIYF
jgi:hypothetical protein